MPLGANPVIEGSCLLSCATSPADGDSVVVAAPRGWPACTDAAAENLPATSAPELNPRRADRSSVAVGLAAGSRPAFRSRSHNPDLPTAPRTRPHSHWSQSPRLPDPGFAASRRSRECYLAHGEVQFAELHRLRLSNN